MAQDARDKMLSFAKDCGWEVIASEHSGVDVEVEARAGAKPVLLRGLSPFSTAGAVARAVSDPSFFVLRVGEPEPALAWGAWRQAVMGAPIWGSIQAVWGERGLSLAGGFASTGGGHGPLADRFFEAAAPLVKRAAAPGSDPSFPELDPERALRAWPSARGRVGRRALQAAAVLGGIGGAVGSVAAGFPQAAPYCLMVGVGATLALSLDVSAAMVAGPKKKAVQTAKRLSAVGLFDEVSKPRTVETLRLPVIRAPKGLRYDDTAGLVRVGIEATSSKHDLSMRLCACSTIWPDDVLGACRMLPDAWLVVEMRGPGPMLDRFPLRQGMRREGGVLRWLIGEQQVASEVFWQVLEEVERGLRVGTDRPYR